MMRACREAGQSFGGAVPIAAFADPANADAIICWADGQIAKSPPPDANGSVAPAFDRVVYRASTGGYIIALIEAGYRSQLTVTPP